MKAATASIGQRCPTCQRPTEPIAPQRPVRRCAKCHRVMGRHDKFKFNRRGRLQHRHCDNPTSYYSMADLKRLYPGMVKLLPWADLRRARLKETP